MGAAGVPVVGKPNSRDPLIEVIEPRISGATDMIDQGARRHAEDVGLGGRVLLQELELCLLGSLPFRDGGEIVDVPPDQRAQRSLTQLCLR